MPVLKRQKEQKQWPGSWPNFKIYCLDQRKWSWARR